MLLTAGPRNSDGSLRKRTVYLSTCGCQQKETWTLDFLLLTFPNWSLHFLVSFVTVHDSLTKMIGLTLYAALHANQWWVHWKLAHIFIIQYSPHNSKMPMQQISIKWVIKLTALTLIKCSTRLKTKRRNPMSDRAWLINVPRLKGTPAFCKQNHYPYRWMIVINNT